MQTYLERIENSVKYNSVELAKEISDELLALPLHERYAAILSLKVFPSGKDRKVFFKFVDLLSDKQLFTSVLHLKDIQTPFDDSGSVKYRLNKLFKMSELDLSSDQFTSEFKETITNLYDELKVCYPLFDLNMVDDIKFERFPSMWEHRTYTLHFSDNFKQQLHDFYPEVLI